MNTCPASRHTYQIGCALMRGDAYPPLQEQPQQCGESLMATVAALFRARAQVNAAIELLDGFFEDDLSRLTGIRRVRCQELLKVLRGE
jgi:hypothetical protein